MRKASPLFSSTELVCGLESFPPGVASSEFSLGEPLWNLSYTFSGTVREVLPGHETRQFANDLMVLKPGSSHRWEVPSTESDPWRVVWFVFEPRPEWVPLLDLPEELPRYSRTSLSGRKNHLKIRCSLLNAYRLAKSPRGGTALAMNALERALLWLQADQQTRQVRLDPRISSFLELFSRRLADPPSIAEAAASCGLSPTRLNRLFLAAIGQTPQRWLENARLKQARYLLISSGLPVKAVADAAGYRDQRYFATRFRREFGLTPTEYRAKEAKR